jgi:hypothetical protein
MTPARAYPGTQAYRQPQLGSLYYYMENHRPIGDTWPELQSYGSERLLLPGNL